MIEYKSGDILAENVEALVNTVNCVGVMGRGIALQFKRAFPANFEAYFSACKMHEVQPGRMFVFETNFLRTLGTSSISLRNVIGAEKVALKTSRPGSARSSR